ncbi:MAG: ATPase, partial [Sphingomonadaceae bacterium]
MQSPAPLRIPLSCLAAIAGFALAWALGASGEPAALTGAIAALGAWFAWRSHGPEPIAAKASDEIPQPNLDEVLEAIDDPMLLVSGQIVTIANSA